MAARAPRVLQFVQGFAEESAPVFLLPCTGWNLEALLSDSKLIVQKKWRCVADNFEFPVTLLCHLVTGGPCCFIWPQYDNFIMFQRHHTLCLQNNEALVLTAPAWGKASSGDTYVLVPLRGIRAGQPVSVFGVYATTPEVGHTFLYATLRCRRLPVVFDLDETLIKAKAENSLDRKPQEEYPGRRAEAEQIADAAERQRALESLQVEYKLYAEDLAMLRTYADRNEVLTPDGLLLHARPEPGGFFDLSSRTVTPVHRPVIRGPLQDGNPLRVFTRINPGNVDTSMVLYLRPQWPAVFEKFAGVGSRPNGPHQPLVEAYVCTAGQGSYAHEAWRVLDHGAALIPSDKWERRSVTDVSTGRGERKTLTRVLRAAARTDSRRSVLPLAVILDDSVEVWEDHVRDQVYRIEVFDYYSERAKMQVDNVQQWPSGPQLEMAAEVILRLRKEMFVEIDKLRAFFDHATLTGALDMDQAGSLEGAYTNMVPPPPWVSRLLPRITAQVRRQWQEKAAAAAVVQRPPPPRDPRLSLMQARQQQQRQLPPPAAPAVAATPANDAVFATLWTKNLQTSSRLRQGTASEQMERPAPQAGALRRPQTAPQAENPQLEVDDSRQVLRPAVPRTEEHAVVKLSQFAQREGLHLTYESEAPLPPSSEWRVRVRLAGRGSISGKGLSEEDAREHAAQRALEEESKSGGVGRGDRNARDDSGDRQPRQRSRSRERGSKRRSPSAGHSRSPRSHNEPRRELPRDEITRYNVQAYFSDYFPKHKVRFKETVLQPEGKGGMAKVRLQLGDYDVIGEGMQCNWARKDAMLKILRLHGVEVNMAG